MLIYRQSLIVLAREGNKKLGRLTVSPGFCYFVDFLDEVELNINK